MTGVQTCALPIYTTNNAFDTWLRKVTNSSLWAAYGDALGFITEMADEKKVKYRTGLSEISSPIGWKRKIGGMYGVNVQLPKGCYSDDTQLRLSVSRAIGHNGHFDIDSFAHIEIPVWMSYQLGGGIATNLAAKNLTKRSVGWATNFFKTKKSSYVNGGGNGAAMRIQPHVWSHPANLKSSDLVKNILIDAICTHGHPRGILGALFHGFCLYYSMVENCVPKPNSWRIFLSELKQVPFMIQDDPMLGLAWLPTWEELAKASFEETWTSTISEMMDDIALIEPLLTAKGPRTYLNVVKELGCFEPKWRGTGTKTALLASALVLIADNNPKLCAQYSANALNSDTDTIGTMAAAIAGALSEEPPIETVQDSDYISQEALKLANIRFSRPSNIFVYPSTSSWKAPKTNSDAVFEHNQKLYLAGLGSLESLDESIPDSKGSFIWEWVKTS